MTQVTTLIKNIFDSLKKRLRAFLTYKEVLTFTLFFLLATLMWYVHALNSVRERSIDVAVAYTGLPDNIGLAEPLPDRITVRLRDAGKRLMGYKEVFRSPITIDLSEQIRGDKGNIHLSADQIKPKINDLLLGTTKLQEVIPEAIDRAYFKEHEKTVPVLFQGEINAAKQYEVNENIVLEPKKISIYGQKSQLDTLKHVLTKPLVLNQVKDTVRVEVQLQPIDGVRMQTTTVMLQATADQYTERVFQMPIHALGVPKTQRLRLFPEIIEVRCRVKMQYYQTISEDDIYVSCQYPTDSEQKKLEVKATSKNSNITITRLTPTEVEYIIEK